MEGLLENKREYVEHLCDLLGDSFVRELQSVYDASRKDGSTDALQAFQHSMVTIPKWNVDIVKELRERVEAAAECTYLGKLLKAVFTVSMQVYLLQAGRTKDKVKVRVPSLDVFLHHCLVEFARIIWKRPYLFYHGVRSLERQKNWALCERLSRKAIVTTLRKSLPMDDIVDRVTTMEPGDADVAKSSDESSDATSSSSDDGDSSCSNSSHEEPAEPAEPEPVTDLEEPVTDSEEPEPQPDEKSESDTEEPEPEPEQKSEPDTEEPEPELEQKSEPDTEEPEPQPDEESDTDEPEPERASSTNSSVNNEPVAEVRRIMIHQSDKEKKPSKHKLKTPYDAFF